MASSVPFKIYNARNASSKEAFVYLGKASKKGFNGYDRDYFAHQYEQGCQAIFLLATISSTRNIKVHKASETNPYIVLQTKDYQGLDNKFITEEKDVDKTSVYKRTEVDNSTIDRTIRLRTFKTDESMKIVDYENEYDLQTWKYDFSPACVQNSMYYKRRGIPSKSNVKFYPKGILPGRCIRLDYEPDKIIFSVVGAFPPEVPGQSCCKFDECDLPVKEPIPYCSWSPKGF